MHIQSTTFLVIGTCQGGQQTTSKRTSVVFWDQLGVGITKWHVMQNCQPYVHVGLELPLLPLVVQKPGRHI